MSAPITWRPWRPEDTEALLGVFARQCAAAKVGGEFPDFGDPRYLKTLVAERAGVIIGAASCHATVELLWLSDDATMLLSLAHRWEEMKRSLRALGVESVHVFEALVTQPKLDAFLKRLGLERLHWWATYWGRI